MAERNNNLENEAVKEVLQAILKTDNKSIPRFQKDILRKEIL